MMTQITCQRIAQLKGVCDLEPSDLKLKSYSGELIIVLGQLPVVVTYGEKKVVQVVCVRGRWGGSRPTGERLDGCTEGDLLSG